MFFSHLAKNSVPHFHVSPLSKYFSLNHGAMSQQCKVTVPAKIGERLSEVDTPALVIHKRALYRNLERMKLFLEQTERKMLFRPHTKTHKCPTLAKLQIERGGAVGVCCQKLDEVEAMIEGGVLDILLTNQCVGEKKLRRLCELAGRAERMAVLVDDVQNTRDLARHAESVGVHLDVLIEVNGGQNRCGINIADPVEGSAPLVVQLAQLVSSCKNLHFKGVHCYGGWLQHVRDTEERMRRIVDGPVKCAREAVNALKSASIECEIITGAGTGSYLMETAGGIHNELQPGSYCFMDADYGRNKDGHDVFENALFIHATVVSKANVSHRAVLDAGLKAASLDSGPPVLISGYLDGTTRVENVSFSSGGDEHGVLDGEFCKSLSVGDTVRLIPGHIDPTVNMHHFLVVMDDVGASDGEPRVVDVWEVSGRSPGL